MMDKKLYNTIEMKYDDREKMQAAYALNLCTVSVSQIVDYNDINILEQEYEIILNNLNLKNMPKDEALLDILRRLLEAIAFFRIQEGDKQFFEREYQQTMKNAVWSAVPNLALLISGGNPISMLATLVTQVGIGYMNYRKIRSQTETDKERQKWALQKAAMEQFESLQQQLFVTAWHLADEYDFPDEYRLTQRQIKQYDAILMDSDEIRKYERLDSIKDKFVAYPPFWYYLGNAAISISNREDMKSDEKAKYIEMAKEHFERYRSCNKYNLLREDAIAASCNLEYATLLDPEKEKEKIEELIDSAMKYVGNSWDVVQICAFNYLRIGEVDKAGAIMRRLVNEEYNTESNAQLLSRIYVEKAIKDRDDKASADYKLLAARVGNEYLFPMPQSISTSWESLENSFIVAQRNILLSKFEYVFDEFISKYTKRINSIFPLPIYEDNSDYYLGKAKYERYYQFTRLLNNQSFINDFYDHANTISFSQEVLAILSDMFNSVCTLDCIKSESIANELARMIETKIVENKEKILAVDETIKSESGYIVDIYKKSQEVTLKILAADFFMKLGAIVQKYSNKMNEMSDFVKAETNLMDFCDLERLQMPEIRFKRKKSESKNKNIEKRYFSDELLKAETLDGDSAIEKIVETISQYTYADNFLDGFAVRKVNESENGFSYTKS